MLWTGGICFGTWLISFLSWWLNVRIPAAESAHLEAARWLLTYFLFNSILDYKAAQWVTSVRIRWHTEPLRKLLLASILLHVIGGLGFVLGLEYERPYMMGLLAVAVVQVALFFGPWAHKRFGYHHRQRRRVSGHSRNGVSIVNGSHRG